MIYTAVSSTVEGSVVIGIDMNVSDAEKELARLKKKIINLEGDIGERTFKSDVLKERLHAATKEYDSLKEKIKDIDSRFLDVEAPFEKKRITELGKEIGKLEKEIENVDIAIDNNNIDLEFTKWQYGKIAKEADRLRSITDKPIGTGEKELKEISENAEISNQAIVDLNKELSNLKIRQKELESAGIGLGYAEYDQNAARISAINQELKEYKKNLTDVADAEKSAIPDSQSSERTADSQARINTYLEKTSSLYQKLNSMIGKTTEMSGVLQDIAASTGGKLSSTFQAAGKAVGSFGAAFSSVLTKITPFLAIAGAVISVVKMIWSAMKKFAAGFTEALKRGASAVYNFSTSVARNFVAALKAIGKFGSSAIKVISSITKKFFELSKNFNVFSKVSDSVRQKFKQLGSTLKSALVFSVIYQGLSMVKQQIGSYLSVNDQFVTAVRRMQGVLLTAFQPVYDVIIPALTTLINVLARAAATVSQFFASLFGTTAKQAQTNAKDLYEQANATTAAGDAAEEAAKQFAGFDEINKLEGSKKAGGGGSTSVDTGPLFDYEYDETPFKTWGEAFDNFLDKLLGGIPKLEASFKNFADWLNDLSSKLYEMFTFPGVLEKVKQLGRDLANALNKLVNWINWEMLGRALGSGLNLALNFLTSFLYTFDWINLGKKLADFVNGLADEIDWYEFGRLLWAGFKISLETLAGFIIGLDMPLMAQAANNIIYGFFDEMIHTIEEIQWHRIGEQIALFLDNIDWYGLITSVANALGAALIAFIMMAQKFIATLEWHKIAEQIYTAINDAIGNESLFKNLGITLSRLVIHIFDFIREIVANTDWEQVGADIAGFILGFDWVGALGSLAGLIADGINAAIRLLRGFLDKAMPEIRGIADGLAERFRTAIGSVEWFGLGQVIGDGIKTALSFVSGLLNPDMFYEIGKAVGDFLIGLDWPGIIGGLGEALANGINSAIALVSGFLESVKPNLKEIAKNIAEKINKFVKDVDWAELGRVINDGINTALDFLLDILDQLDWDEIGNAIVDFLSNLNWGEILKKWGTVVGKAIGGVLKSIDLSDALWLGNSIIDGLWKGMLNKWDESGGIGGWIKRTLFDPFISSFQSLFGIASPSKVMEEQGNFVTSGLLNGISNTWHTITEFFSEKLDAIKQTLTDTWENIKTTASTKWENIKSVLGTTWENIKENASTSFTNIKEKITSIWDNVREKTTSVWSNVTSDLSSKWNTIKSTAENSFNNIKSKIITIWSNVKSETSSKWSEIKSKLSSTWETIKTDSSNKFQEIKKSVIDKMEDLKNNNWTSIGESIVGKFIDGLQAIWKTLTQWARDVKDTISDALSGTERSRGGGFGGSSSGGYGRNYRMEPTRIPDISTFNIPALASGAVIPPNREFLAVLGDQKTGTNIETPVPTMIQAFKQALGEMGMAGRNQTVILQVNESELGRVVYRLNNKEQQRVGVRLVETRS